MEIRNSIPLRYGLVAALGSGVNLASQWLFCLFYSGALQLKLALVLGTGTGLLTKFFLHKLWVFGDFSAGLEAQVRKFTLYTLLGVIPTVIFWGTELAFEAMRPHSYFRYVGGALGLGVGYMLKYLFDRRFVFAAAL